MFDVRACETAVCLQTLDQAEPWSLAAYQAKGGWQIWPRVIKGELSRAEIIEQLKISGLRGRGGAGFPTGLKLSFVDAESPGQKYLVCNSDEGEPGTCKDREILRMNPHQLLEGMAIAAYVMGATVGYNYLRGEFAEPFERCEQALAEAIDAGFLGENIQGGGVDMLLHNVLGAGAYIVGEETAMLESLEGKRAMPRFKPPFPAQAGLYGKPTTVNNTETLASIPLILAKGGQWFADLGCKNSGGTKLFSVSGHVAKPGVYEIPLGMPFKDLLAQAGGMREGRQLKAVIPGGTSMRVMPADVVMAANCDYDGLTEAGSAVGSGGMIVMDDTTCMVDTLACMMHFYQHESCGQCTPCREGSGWVYRILKKILNQQAELADIDRLFDVAKNIEGRTICAFGEAISWPVTSFVEHFRDEFEYFIEHGQSMVDNQQGE